MGSLRFVTHARLAALAATLCMLGCGGSSAHSDAGDHDQMHAAGGDAGLPSGGDAQTGAGGDTSDASVLPFEADPPRVYIAKVKNVLVGLPPTDDEVASVIKDPSALHGLIQGWMKLPQYAEKMQTFFELSFQQTQVTINDFADQTYPHQAVANQSLKTLLARNAQESFARTMLAQNAAGKAFSDALTTHTFMLTPALMEFYAFLDVWQVGDDGKVDDRYKTAHQGETIMISASSGPIPIADTLNPKSANYMHWYDPDVGAAQAVAGCDGDPIVYPARGDVLHFLMYGSLLGRPNTLDPKAKQCQQFGGSPAAPQLTAADFTTWKLVTIRPPADGETRTNFFDLPTLRNGTELVLTLPRVGFFSTPAFYANWQTNISNQMRVTINQTLIVALGAAVDGSDNTIADSTPGLDAMHAQSADCFSCHQSLDPTRSIFASSYSWNYHAQTETSFAQQKGRFVFQGVQKSVSGLDELGSTLVDHPLFASAWVQKLCYYVGSSACDTSDPEFVRVVSSFKSSGYRWDALVAELLSSPLITHAERTQSADKLGVTIAVSRRDHLCAALNARLGLQDVCGLEATTLKGAHGSIPQIATGLPSDGYGRGAIAPVLPNEPTLFYRAGVENICATVAALVIDPKDKQVVAGQRTWSSKTPEPAIDDFVSTIMALTKSDPRSAPVHDALLEHFHAAMSGGASATVALRSTFVVACSAPSAISMGL